MAEVTRYGRELALYLCLTGAVLVPRPAAAASDPPATPAVAWPNWSLNDSRRNWAIRPDVEVGFIGVIAHGIQLGRDGTRLDYVREGGQDVLFPVVRLSTELELYKHHNITFLYQPINLRTDAVFRRDVRLYGVDFPSGTPVDLRYGFDYFRLGYGYDIFKDPRYELSFGVGLQIRNANLTFTSVDGELRTSSHDIGLVPLLRARGRYTFRNGFWLGLTADGFYAAGRIVTGSLNSFVGAIYDVSAQAGFRLTGFLDVYLNLRFVGGGARGTERNPTPPSDGYTDNWLHTAGATIGFGFR